MARVITIGKKRWLVGMSWASLEDKPSKAELKSEAERFKAQWSCVRIGDSTIQAGFSSVVDDAKYPKKIYSLAALLADGREQPWLGTFKVAPDTWWYIAVRDAHQILPDGDVVGGEAEIHAAREAHSGYGDWNYFEGDLETLVAFMDESGAKPTPVRALNGPAIPVIPLAASLGVLVIAAGGYSYWDMKQKEEAAARQAAMTRMRAQMAANKPLVVVPSPLLTTPEPDLWLAACGQAVKAVPLVSSGWIVERVSCNASSVQVGWARTEGATVAFRPDGVLSPMGEKVEQTIPLVGLKPSGQDKAIPLTNAKLILRAWAQKGNFGLNITDAPPSPTVLPGATQNTAALPPPIPQSKFAMSLPVSPFGLSMAYVPGLRITSAATAEQGWTLEGVIYGR